METAIIKQLKVEVTKQAKRCLEFSEQAKRAYYEGNIRAAENFMTEALKLARRNISTFELMERILSKGIN